MKIKYLIIILIIISLIIIALKTFTTKKKEIKNSKELELTYKISAGIPFRWEYEIGDESIVQFVKKYVVKDENTNGKVGAHVYTNYVFKGLKQGTTTITFKCINFTDPDFKDIEERTHHVKVDKEGNIFLIEEE